MSYKYPLYTPLPNPSVTTVFTVDAGQRFIQFFNNGLVDITIESYGANGVLGGILLCKAGMTMDVPERVDGNMWGEFIVDAVGTDVRIYASNELPVNN